MARATGLRGRLHEYALLMRLDKPIGAFLLLWPTLWALMLAGHGHPDGRLVLIFLAGVVLMRSAGCVINDFADREFDPHVARTRYRPLAAGRVSRMETLALFTLLALMAFGLVLLTNRLTVICPAWPSYWRQSIRSSNALPTFPRFFWASRSAGPSPWLSRPRQGACHP